MNSKAPSNKAKKSRKAAAPDAFLLKLYVTGATSKSLRAIANIKRICEKHLAGQYSLEVIDIYQRPELAKEDQIIAAPTLVKCHPVPLKRWIGDVTNPDRVLAGLQLLPKAC
ncbi:MAG TPA: circadian clock KaiB family protein [Verrucomicrobiae bacterium]|nr:circadian clock KaiB family protein [Verrucomicrobiae bacterium]